MGRLSLVYRRNQSGGYDVHDRNGKIGTVTRRSERDWAATFMKGETRAGFMSRADAGCFLWENTGELGDDAPAPPPSADQCPHTSDRKHEWRPVFGGGYECVHCPAFSVGAVNASTPSAECPDSKTGKHDWRPLDGGGSVCIWCPAFSVGAVTTAAPAPHALDAMAQRLGAERRSDKAKTCAMCDAPATCVGGAIPLHGCDRCCSHREGCRKVVTPSPERGGAVETIRRHLSHFAAMKCMGDGKTRETDACTCTACGARRSLAALSEVEAALKPFAHAADKEDGRDWSFTPVSVTDCRRARAVLKGE